MSNSTFLNNKVVMLGFLDNYFIEHTMLEYVCIQSTYSFQIVLEVYEIGYNDIRIIVYKSE